MHPLLSFDFRGPQEGKVKKLRLSVMGLCHDMIEKTTNLETLSTESQGF